MKRRFLACRGFQLGLVLAGVGAVVAGTTITDARAEPEGQAGPPTVSVTSSSCLIKGTAPMPKDTLLFDAPTDGRAIAKFTGAFVPLQISDFPSDPSLLGRVKVSTSRGEGALRIDGYAPLSAMTFYSTRDIQVLGGNIWISAAQKVKLVKSVQDSLSVELTIGGSQNQTLKTLAPCDAFSVERGKPIPMEIAGNARGFLMKKETLDLYDSPNGSVIFTLNMMEGTGQLFWSTETRAGFVHVQSRGDITIDAWARWRDLDPLKKGEMMDQLIPPTTQVQGAQLAIDKPPPLVKASKSIPIRSKRDEKDKPIGAIEVNAEVYMMETVAGWTNVLPKGLGILPPDDGGFWIPSSEAPK